MHNYLLKELCTVTVQKSSKPLHSSESYYKIYLTSYVLADIIYEFSENS